MKQYYPHLKFFACSFLLIPTLMCASAAEEQKPLLHTSSSASTLDGQAAVFTSPRSANSISPSVPVTIPINDSELDSPEHLRQMSPRAAISSTRKRLCRFYGFAAWTLIVGGSCYSWGVNTCKGNNP